MELLNGTLHRTAEHDAAFQLLGNTFGNQLRIQFRLANFRDRDVCRNTHQLVTSRRSVSISSPFLPITIPGRAV